MSRFPHTAEGQRIYPSQSSNHLHSSNPYSHFQDGHVPTYPDNADWTRLRDPTKPSTDSMSSFQSWTSEDRSGFSSHTSSFSQSTSAAIQTSPLSKTHNRPPPPYTQEQQQQQQQQPQGQRPRGDSLSLGVPGRYRSDSNASAVMGNFPPGHAANHEQYYNSHHNHSSTLSQSSTHSLQQQQQQQQHREPRHESQRNSQRSQRRRDPSASGRASSSTTGGAGDEPKLRSLDDYEAMLQKMTSPNLGPNARGRDSSRATATSATAKRTATSASRSSASSPAPPATRGDRGSGGGRGVSRGGSRSGGGEEPSLDDFEAMLQEMTSPSLGPREGRSNGTAAAPRRQQEREPREARTDRAPRQMRRQQHQQEQEHGLQPTLAPLKQIQEHGHQVEQPTQHQQREQRQREPRMNESRPNHSGSSAAAAATADPAGEKADFEEEAVDQLPSFDERKLRRRSSLPSKLKSTPDLFANLQRRGSGGSGHNRPSTSNPPLPPRNGQQQQQRISVGDDVPPLLPYRDLGNIKQNPTTAPSFREQHGHLPALQAKRFSWENESVEPRADLLQTNGTNGSGGSMPTRSHSIQRKGSWQGMELPGENQQLHQEQSQGQGQRDLRSIRSSSEAPALNMTTKPRSRTENSGSNSGMTSERIYVASPPPPSLLKQHNARPMTPTNANRTRPGTPLGSIRPPPGPAPVSANAAPQGSATVSRKVTPIRSTKGMRSNSNEMLLQPFGQGSRPRAGSGASMSSISSLNSFTPDRTMTPPPPSSPLPSLPPSANHGTPATVTGASASPYQTPPSSQALLLVSSIDMGPMAGLGIDPQSGYKSASHGTKDLGQKTTSQVVLQENDGEDDHQATLPSPASSLPMSPELNAIMVTTATQQAAHLARLKKRVSLLEKELATAEMEMSSKIQDGCLELQRQVDRLTAERDSLEQRLLSGEEAGATSRRAEIEQQQQEQEQRQQQHLLLLTEKDKEISGLRQDLHQVRFEIQQLKEKSSENEQRLQQQCQDLELQRQRVQKDHSLAITQLEEQIQQLMTDNQQHQEQVVSKERELSASQERSQMEAAQYRTLQDSVQRLSSKIAKVESQHANELQQIHLDHEGVLERTLQEHEDLVEELKQQYEAQKENGVRESQKEMEERFREERRESEASYKVLRARVEEERERRRELEEDLFRMKRQVEDKDKEHEQLLKMNKSLERHVSMQQLKEQETVFKQEELERENARLRAILKDLDVAAAVQMGPDDHEEEEEAKKQKAAHLFEQQQRKWAEHTELVERRLARAEEETRQILEQNEQLRVALEMVQPAQSQFRSRPRSRSRSQSQSRSRSRSRSRPSQPHSQQQSRSHSRSIERSSFQSSPKSQLPSSFKQQLQNPYHHQQSLHDEQEHRQQHSDEYDRVGSSADEEERRDEGQLRYQSQRGQGEHKHGRRYQPEYESYSSRPSSLTDSLRSRSLSPELPL
ncbi:hypothetical protein EDD11_004484 [Mortierella claussenii]|nr:hypothetical protein EDD11_004484 [Mortierella claussenii]